MSFKKRSKTAGHDDMVMLRKSKDGDINENLYMRYNNEAIYTYIGEVLIAVNPFKMIPMYSDDHIDKYRNANPSENPPHIFAVGDSMYNNMLVDKEKQCIIISGESGAGKTVNAKFIMEYISKISGGVGDIERTKEVIMSTNPLLEAFGNAKTTRNNNSSRFGKYFTIMFDYGGQPTGGTISNFLLEKSRVSGIQSGERNFHIFYQMIEGMKSQNMLQDYCLAEPSQFNYLNMSGTYTADNVNDIGEFAEMTKAMEVCGLDENASSEIFQILSGILNLGNVSFQDAGRADGGAQISDRNQLTNVCLLFGIDEQKLEKCLLTSQIKIGRELIDKTLNKIESGQSRNSLAQGIYFRLFDHLVAMVNEVLSVKSGKNLSIGVLDIYGFEIFQNNGFEQLCINYVNEKLQQIFIELTLKQEQEEYKKEGIQWTPIKYKNNLPVCQLIESKIPPGVFAVMDDVSKKQTKMAASAVDKSIMEAIVNSCNNGHCHSAGSNRFTITHYAGVVTYNPSGFYEKNKNTLLRDSLILMQNSTKQLLSKLFTNEDDNMIVNPSTTGARKGVSSAGKKIIAQSKKLVDTLKSCRPHYVRCIKPNETKKYGDWDKERVIHQIKYLGLTENIRVRRAGFAYRRDFDKFIGRYNILKYMANPEMAKPPVPVSRNPNFKNDIQQILGNIVSNDEWQIGKTKLFIKSPESVSLLEDQRERVYDSFARTIQKHCKNYINRAKAQEIKDDSSKVIFGRKDRSRATVKRRYFGDYLGLEANPEYKQYLDKREKILFASKVNKYDGKMQKYPRFCILTNKRIQVLGYEIGKDKNLTREQNTKMVIKFEAKFENLKEVEVSANQDGFLIIKDTWSDVKDPSTADCVIELTYLTEFLYLLLTKAGKEGWINLKFVNSSEIRIKRPKSFIKKYFAVKSNMLNFVVENNLMNVTTVNKIDKRSYNVTCASGLGKDYKDPEIARQTFSSPMQQNNTNSSSYQNQPSQNNMNYGSGLSNKRLSFCRGSQINRPMQGQNNMKATIKKINNTTFSPVTYSANNYGNQGNKTSSRSKDTAHAMSLLSKTASVADQPIDSLYKSNNSTTPLRVAPRPIPKKKPAKAPKQLPKCKALYDYDASDTDEISFRVDDIITIIKKDEGGWWKGQLHGQTGLFPGNYVECI